MESSSRIYTSLSLNTHSSNDIADIADRVVQELRTENGFGDDDVFSFSDDDNPADIRGEDEVNSINRTETVKRNEIDDPDGDEREFEFPVSTDDVISDDQISLRYPVFDRSLLSETDFNLSNGVGSPVTESKKTRLSLRKLFSEDRYSPSISSSETEESDGIAPEYKTTRPSLKKLFSEDRDSPSRSSSETAELDGIAPETYCVWKPKMKTEPPRGKHKKSNSVCIDNLSKRWKVLDLLKRGYSDDNYSAGKDSPVVVFIPPISPDQKTHNEKVNMIGKSGKVGYAGGGGKPEKNIPAYKAKMKIGNIRIPAHYAYRQGQVANFNGSSTNLYRY